MGSRHSRDPTEVAMESCRPSDLTESPWDCGGSRCWYQYRVEQQILPMLSGAIRNFKPCYQPLEIQNLDLITILPRSYIPSVLV